jgi:hypothetical protein
VLVISSAFEAKIFKLKEVTVVGTFTRIFVFSQVILYSNHVSNPAGGIVNVHMIARPLYDSNKLSSHYF